MLTKCPTSHPGFLKVPAGQTAADSDNPWHIGKAHQICFAAFLRKSTLNQLKTSAALYLNGPCRGQPYSDQIRFFWVPLLWQ
jgi:hypothetical protein